MRLIAFLLSCILIWSGFSTHESFEASVSGTHASAHTLPADDSPLAATSGTVDDHHLDDLPSSADLAEHAVLPALLDSPGAHLTMSLSQRTGMADVRSPLVDGLFRPPCVASSRA